MYDHKEGDPPPSMADVVMSAETLEQLGSVVGFCASQDSEVFEAIDKTERRILAVVREERGLVSRADWLGPGCVSRACDQ